MPRIGITLILASCLLMAPASAEDGSFNYYMLYTWDRDDSDAFYRGTVSSPDGSESLFQTRGNEIYFPENSDVVVRPFNAEGKAQPEERVASPAANNFDDEEDLGDDVIITDDGEIIRNVPPIPVGTPEPTDSEPEEPKKPSRLAKLFDFKLCGRYDVAADFYIGSETIDSKASGKDFQADASIGGTQAAMACILHKWPAAKFELDFARHNLAVTFTERNFLGDQEQTRSFSRLEANLRLHYLLATTPFGAWGAGLGYGYLSLPALLVRGDGTDNGRLENQSYRGYSLHADWQWQPGPRGFRIAFEYLGSSDLSVMRLKPAYRGSLWRGLNWQLGLQAAQYNITTEFGCADCPHDADTSDQLFSIFSGLHYRFGEPSQPTSPAK